ncbi:MAG: homocysteine S-methyltransferase family protein, partial [Clostridia bacterium]|nr:homocysteine S-methyltransferase family protein [Clostridia bacterium]
MAEKQPFAEYLAQGVVVFDGAMGTEIYRHHVFTNRCFDELNLSDPKLIRKIHQAYCEAGAEVLTTNTFGANRETLAKYGLAEQVRAINQAGAQIARQVADAADRPVYVAGSVGPLPTLPQNEEVLWQMIWEQVDALLEGGVDFIIFETQPSRQALELCAAA